MTNKNDLIVAASKKKWDSPKRNKRECNPFFGEPVTSPVKWRECIYRRIRVIYNKGTQRI